MRVEQLCKDLEKGKVQGDQSLERVMNANARLLEEKDRVQKELERLSKLYSETIAELHSMQGGNANSAAGAHGKEVGR